MLNTPGYLDWRGSVETSGQFNLSDKWVWGWDATVVSDKNFLYDYGLMRNVATTNLALVTPDYALSQLYLAGRGDRSYFEARSLYFYGFSPSDVQGELPIVHPVIDHDYVFKNPIFGGELGFHNNLISLSRETANFDPISQSAVTNGLCALTTADPAVKNANNCLLRGVPGNYTRFSSEWNWKRTVIDQWGQMFTPFVSMRADVADMDISAQPGVSNYLNVGQTDIGRVMPTAGLEYRYPLINVQSWGTQTIEPIAQFIFRPNETAVGCVPQRGRAKPDLRRFKSVQGEQVFRLGPRRRRRPGQCGRAIYRAVQPRRQRQCPVRTILSVVRAELLRARRQRPIPASTAASTPRSRITWRGHPTSRTRP